MIDVPTVSVALAVSDVLEMTRDQQPSAASEDLAQADDRPRPRRASTPKPETVLEVQGAQRRAGVPKSERAPSSARTPPEVAHAPDSARYGKFIRIEKLGAGGMGEVWRAWDTELHRWAALKFLRGGDEELERFKREAELAGGLSHPHIAAIYEAGEARGQHFIAMQLIDGRSIREIAPGRRRLLATLIRDAARAVAYANAQGVVHRDLKPENLMVTDPSGATPHVFVLDFGLARRTEGASQVSATGTVVGTPSYMAPEQARGERVDGLADVYGLGATLYHLLSGEPPYAGSTVFEVLGKLLREEVTPIRQRDAVIPADLATITMKCLERSPSDRYAGADALADDLDRWLDGEGITARPARAWERLRRRLARHRMAWALGTAAALLLLAISAVLLPQLGETKRKLEASRRDGTEAARRAERLAREALGQSLTTVYLRLSLDTAGAMQTLEGAWRDARTPKEEVEAALGKVDHVAAEVGRLHAEIELPAAWRALAHVLAGGGPRALEALQASAGRSGDDPFPRILLARAYLAQYVKLARLPDTWVGPVEPVRRPFVETTEMQTLRMNARQALSTATRSPVWSTLRGEGAVHLTFAHAVERFSNQDFAGSAAELAAAIDDHLLGREARTLRGLARYLAGQFEPAAEDWEAEGQRSWPRTCNWAGEARVAAALEQMFRGKDPTRNLQTAVANFSLALRGDPGLVEALVNRSKAYGCIAAHHRLTGGDPRSGLQSALADAEAAVAQDPNSGLPRVARGMAHFELAQLEPRGSAGQKGRLMTALEDLEFAAGRRHEDVLVRINRGVVANHLVMHAMWAGQDPEPYLSLALSDCEWVLTQEPDFLNAIIHLATALREKGSRFAAGGSAPDTHWQRAVDLASRAIELAPDVFDAHVVRATVWQYWGRHEQDAGREPGDKYLHALADFDRALTLAPTALDATIKRGIVRFDLAMREAGANADSRKRLLGAAADFRAYLERYPSDRQFRVNRAIALLRVAEIASREKESPTSYFEQALTEFQELIKQDAGDAAAHRNAGFCAEGLRRLDDAIEYFEKSLALMPDQPALQARLEQLKRMRDR